MTEPILNRLEWQESDEKLKLLIEHIPAAIAIFDEDMRYVAASRRWLEDHQLSHRNVLGKSHYALFPALPERWKQAHRQALAGETVAAHEDRVEREDGAVQWHKWEVRPWYAGDGQIAGIIVLTEDITARKEAEATLEYEREVFRNLANMSSDYFWELDDQYRFRAISPSIRERSGLDYQSYIGKTRWELPFIGVSDEQWRQHRSALAAHQPFRNLEAGMVNLQDEIRWFLMSGEPVYSAAGVFTGYRGVTQDITERKLTEQSLKQIAEELDDLYNNAPLGYHSLDRNGIFVRINNTELSWLGYTRDELIGKKRWSDIVAGEDARNFQRLFEEFKKRGYIYNYPYEVFRKDGTTFPALLSASAIYDSDGNYLASRGMVVNITERALAQARLLESEARYRSLFENMNAGFVLFEVVQDAKGTPVDLLILAANTGFEAATGVKLKAAIGKNLTEAVPGIEKDAADWIGTYAKVALTGEPCQLEQKSELLGLVYAVSAYQPAPRQCAVTFQDITERKKSESELRLSAVAFQTQEGIMVTDADSVIQRVNDAFVQITGYSQEEIVGKTPGILRSEKQNSAFYKEMWHCIATTGSWEGELWNRRKGGELYLERLVITAVKDAHGSVVNYVGTFTDITLHRAAAEEIRDLAFYDTLTRLPNRRLLLDRLHQAMTASARSRRKGALLLLDLDNFKMINDTLGHDMGDLLLQQVAERITSALREGDTVARLGGDEFVVLVTDLGEDSLEVAEKAKGIGSVLLAQLNKPFLLRDSLHHNTPSIGLTIFSGSETAEEIMKQADIAMYHSKRAGRNTLRFFDQRMQEAINVHAALERDLRMALEQGQFMLFYQIQVDGRGSPVGAEALIRWNHPDKGIISPAQFIPVAEESDLILGLGDWILETACAQLAAWSADPATRDLILSVNVSSRQIRHSNFVEKLRGTVARHDVRVSHLKLEITESTLLEDTESTVEVMDRLSTLGVNLILDDFGTGYSSLSYLKRLPIDQIKIDQSFVRDMITSQHDIALVHTIITMAHNLHISTIAEGVETDLQFRILENSGCDTYQGYFFGRPLPVAQFERLVREHKSPV